MSQLSGIRSALKTSLEGVTGGGWTCNASRVKLGYVPTLYLASPDFLRSLKMNADPDPTKCGPYITIASGSMQSYLNLNGKRPLYTIPINLYLGIDLNSDNDFVNIETFTQAVAAAIKAAGQIDDVSYELNDKDLRNDPATVLYEFKVNAFGCS